jgi:MoxR-like ATPase
MAAQDNHRVERPRDVRTLLMRCFKVGRPAMIWGPPGIGKSELIAEIGAETNRPVIDMRLLLLEPTDIKGIPYYDPETQTMKWAQPADLPQTITEREIKRAQEVVDAARKSATERYGEGGKKDASLIDEDDEVFVATEKLQALKLLREQSRAILFLDEVNAAPPSVQAAAYQLILNRRVGEYHLPKDVSMVCAGNRDSDKGVTYRMPSPLANRLVHMEMGPNFEDWQKWAIMSRVHADVVGFLSHHKQKLFNFDPKSPDKAFATPRSWVFVSQLITDELPESMNTALVAGTVGDGLATEFAAHRKVAARMPKSEDVLMGKVKDLSVKDLSAMYSLTISMCYTLKEWAEKAKKKEEVGFGMDEWHQCVDHFFKFMMDNFQTEMTVLGAKTALRDYQLPINHRQLKEFKVFHDKYGKYILED